ncbi:MAG TPA: DUF4126 domain-containing protein [Vicinamibacteria bacterium]|nr:DUF4126 domain-containing protein [Vicinamibacteria bacterium]
MDTVALGETVSSLALAIGLAACAGLRAWLPLLLAGGLARAEVLTLGPSFGFLASDRALVLFAIASVIEIVGDKIPAVDHALDMLSTVLRPAAGALLAASVMWEIRDPLVALAVGLAIGAPSAMVPHAAKSVLRAASTTLTGGLANPVISLAEDVIAVAVFVFTVLVPLLAAATILVVAVLVLRRLARRSAPSLRTT